MIIDETERLNASSKKYKSLHKDVTKVINTIDKTPNSEWAVLNSNLTQLQKLITSASAKIINEPVIFADSKSSAARGGGGSSGGRGGGKNSGGGDSGGGLISLLGGGSKRTAQQKHDKAMAEQQWQVDDVSPSDLLTDFPGKAQLFAVMVKCMDPSIAMGVHKKAVETLAIVCGRLSPSLLCEYLPLFTLPLFCLLQSSANQVRPDILNLIESYLICLPLEGLRTGGLTGIISAVLPSMLEKDLAVKAKHILDVLRERFDTLDGTVSSPLNSHVLATTTASSSLSKASGGGGGGESTHLSALALQTASNVAQLQKDGTPVTPPVWASEPQTYQCLFYRTMWSIIRNAPDARTPALRYMREILPKASSTTGAVAISPTDRTAGGGCDDQGSSPASAGWRAAEKTSLIPIAMLGGEGTPTNNINNDDDDDVDNNKVDEWGCNSRATNYVEVVVDAITASLMDKQEVQRQALDLLVYHFPLSDDGVLSFGHKVLLIRAVLRILVSNQNATLRRVFMWFYGGDTVDEKYFQEVSCDLVVAALTEMLNDSTDAAIRVRQASHLASQAASAALMVGSFAGSVLHRGGRSSSSSKNNNNGPKNGNRSGGGGMDVFGVDTATDTLLNLLDDSMSGMGGGGGGDHLGTGVLVTTRSPLPTNSNKGAQAVLVSEDGLTTATFTSSLVFEVLVALLSRPSDEESFLLALLPPLVPTICRYFNVFSMASLSSASAACNVASNPANSEGRSVKFIGTGGGSFAAGRSAHSDKADSLLTSVDAKLNDVMNGAVGSLHGVVPWSYFLKHVSVELLGPLLGDTCVDEGVGGANDGNVGCSEWDATLESKYRPFLVGYGWSGSAATSSSSSSPDTRDGNGSGEANLLGDSQTLLQTLRAAHVISEGTRPAYLSHLTTVAADHLDYIAQMAVTAKGVHTGGGTTTEASSTPTAMSKEILKFQAERDRCLLVVFTLCRQLCRIVTRLLRDAAHPTSVNEGGESSAVEEALRRLQPFAVPLGGGDAGGGQRTSNLPRAVLEVFQGFYFGVAQGLLTTKAMEEQTVQQLENKIKRQKRQQQQQDAESGEVVPSSQTQQQNGENTGEDEEEESAVRFIPSFCPSTKHMTAVLYEDLLDVYREASNVALAFYPECAKVSSTSGSQDDDERALYDTMLEKSRPGYMGGGGGKFATSSLRGTPSLVPSYRDLDDIVDITTPPTNATGFPTTTSTTTSRPRSESLAALGRQATRAERDERQASVLPYGVPQTEGLTNFLSELSDTIYSVYSHVQKEARAAAHSTTSTSASPTTTIDSTLSPSSTNEKGGGQGVGFEVDARPAASTMPWWLRRTLLLVHTVDPALAVCAAQLYLDVLLGELSLLPPDAFPTPVLTPPQTFTSSPSPIPATTTTTGGGGDDTLSSSPSLASTFEAASYLVLGRLWPLMAATQSTHHVQVTKLLVRSYAAHPYLRHVLDDLMTRADAANIRYFSSLFHMVTECKRSGLGNAANDPSLFFPGLKAVLRLRLDVSATRAASSEMSALAAIHARHFDTATLRRSGSSSAVSVAAPASSSATFAASAMGGGGGGIHRYGGSGSEGLLLRAFVEQSLPYFRRVIDPLLFELLTIDFRSTVNGSPYTATSRLSQLQQQRALAAAGIFMTGSASTGAGSDCEYDDDDDLLLSQQLHQPSVSAEEAENEKISEDDTAWLNNFCVKAQEFVDLIHELVDISGASVVASLLAMPAPSFARHVIGKSVIPSTTTADPSSSSSSPREVFLVPVNQAVRYGVDEDVPRHSSYGLIIYILLRLIRKCAHDSMQPLYTDQSGQYDDRALLGLDGVPGIEEGFVSQLSTSCIALLKQLISLGCEVAETLAEEDYFGAEAAVGGLGSTSSAVSSAFSPVRSSRGGGANLASVLADNHTSTNASDATGDGVSLFCSPTAVVTLVANCCTHVGSAIADLLKIAVAIRLPSAQVLLLETLHTTQQFLDAAPRELLLITPIRTTLSTTAFTPPASMGLAMMGGEGGGGAGVKSAMKRSKRRSIGNEDGIPSSSTANNTPPRTFAPSMTAPAPGVSTSDILVLRFTERPPLFQTPGFITTLKSGLLAASVAELHPVLCSYGLLSKWRSITTRILPLLHAGLPTATHELMHTYSYVITVVKRRQLSPLSATVMRQCLEGLVDLFNYVFVGANRNFSSSENPPVSGGGGRSGSAHTGADFLNFTSWLGGGGSANQGNAKNVARGLFKRASAITKNEAIDHSKQAQAEVVAFLETLVATLTDVYVTTHQSIEHAMAVSHRDAQTSLRLTQASLAHHFQHVLASLVRYTPAELFDRIVWLWMRRNINVVGSAVLASSPIYAAAAAFYMSAHKQQRGLTESSNSTNNTSNTKLRSNTLAAIGDNCTDFWSPANADSVGGSGGDGGDVGSGVLLSDGDRGANGLSSGPSRSALTDSLVSLLVQLFTPHQVVEMSSQLLSKLRSGQIKGGAALGTAAAADAVTAAVGTDVAGGSVALHSIYHRALSAFAQLELPYDAAVFHFTASYFQAALNPDQWIIQGLLLDMVQQHLSSSNSGSSSNSAGGSGGCSMIAVPFALNLLEVVHSRHAAASGMGRGSGDVLKDKRMCAIALRVCELVFPAALSDMEVTGSGIVALRLLSRSFDDVIPKALQADGDWSTPVQGGVGGGGGPHGGTATSRGGVGAHATYSMGHRELTPYEVKSVDALCNLTQKYLIPSLKQAMDGKDSEAIVALSSRSEVVLEVLGKILRLAEYPQKKLRYDLLDLFFSEPFFRVSRGALTKWRDVLGLLTLDRTLNAAVAQRISTKTSSMFTSIVTSVDEEAISRARVLKRLAYYVLSTSTLDPVFVSLLKEKMVDTFKSFQGAGQVAIRHALLLFRILLLRLQPAVLSGFWPVVLPEMLRILASYKMATDAPICMEVLKIVDLSVVLLPSEFQVFRWAFMDDDQNVSTEALRKRNVHRRSKYTPASLYQSSKSNCIITSNANQVRTAAASKRGGPVGASTAAPSCVVLDQGSYFVPLIRGLHKSVAEAVNMSTLRREAVPASALSTAAPDVGGSGGGGGGSLSSRGDTGPKPYTHLNRPLLAYPERCYLDLKGIEVACSAFTALSATTTSEGTAVLTSSSSSSYGNGRGQYQHGGATDGFVEVASAAHQSSKEGSATLIGDLVSQSTNSSIGFIPRDGDAADRQYILWLLEAEFVHILGDAGEQFHALRRHTQGKRASGGAPLPPSTTTANHHYHGSSVRARRSAGPSPQSTYQRTPSTPAPTLTEHQQLGDATTATTDATTQQQHSSRFLEDQEVAEEDEDGAAVDNGTTLNNNNGDDHDNDDDGEYCGDDSSPTSSPHSGDEEGEGPLEDTTNTAATGDDVPTTANNNNADGDIDGIVDENDEADHQPTTTGVVEEEEESEVRGGCGRSTF